MAFLIALSNVIVPILLVMLLVAACIRKIPAYDCFTKGARDGLRVVVDILPTLLGLMLAVGVLRASGALTALAACLAPLAGRMHFPAALVPMVLVKMLSSSAATSLLLDIFREYGPDSYEGFLASVIMSSTETIFYTMAVYFAAAKVRRGRFTLAGALLVSLVGVVVAVWLVG